MSGLSSLIEETDDKVRILRLNRPAAMNALDTELVGALGAALVRARDDAAIRAILLTGEGGSFCSGADLKEALATLGQGQGLDARVAPFQENIRLIAGTPKPVVAAVDGAAVGFGADLALACDLRLLSVRAYLQEKFVGIGLMPDGGATFHLPRLVGIGRALELLLLGEKIEAARALELGLANRVVAVEALFDEALALCRRLAEGPPLALARIKAATRAALSSTLDEALAREGAGQAELLRSADLAEGVGAWAARRKANFQGR
ncbi:MAG TPA: enoyl-CoA hydratase-related protein [Polyangiaceae bacterium]|nr:enoyl-CoA hydratase-related protein [Polyangiaceae bacterium]